jgi:hypothetical protein
MHEGKPKSIGHLLFHGDREYIRLGDDIYEAPIDAPMDIWGRRMAARFVCTAAAWPLWRRVHGA